MTDNVIRARLDDETRSQYLELIGKLKLNPDDYGVEAKIIKFAIRFTNKQLRNVLDSIDLETLEWMLRKD